MTSEELEIARMTWPSARIVKARKPHRCDWSLGNGQGVCPRVIQPGDEFVDPGEANPENAGGFGGYRYCALHFKLEAA